MHNSIGFFPQAGANGIHWDIPSANQSWFSVNSTDNLVRCFSQHPPCLVWGSPSYDWFTEASHFFPSPGGWKNPAKIPMELPSEIPLENPLWMCRSKRPGLWSPQHWLICDGLAHGGPGLSPENDSIFRSSHRFVDDFPIAMFDMFDMFDSYDVILDDFNINFIFWGYSCSDLSGLMRTGMPSGPWMPSGAEIHDGCPPADKNNNRWWNTLW